MVLVTVLQNKRDFFIALIVVRLYLGTVTQGRSLKPQYLHTQTCLIVKERERNYFLCSLYVIIAHLKRAMFVSPFVSSGQEKILPKLFPPVNPTSETF